MVDEGDRDGEGQDAPEDRARREVALGAHRLRRAALVKRAPEGLGDRPAHLEERPRRAHQHRPDRDRPDLVVPDREDHLAERRGLPARRELGAEAGVEEEGERDEDEPREHAPREVDGGELEADDVADADEGGRDGRRRPHEGSPVRHVAEGGPARVEVVDDRGRELPHHLEALPEETDARGVLEDLDQHPEAHRPEDVARSAVAALARLHDLRARAALGEGQAGVDRERAAQEDDEQDPEQAPDEQDERRLPVAEAGPQPLAPHVHEDEGGDGEDGARGEGFPHRGGRAHGVLLEDRPAEERQAEGGDGEDGGRERGRDGLARLEAEVGVRRTEERRHDDAEEERLQGQLGQALPGGNERLLFVAHGRFASSSRKRRDDRIRIRRAARRAPAAAAPGRGRRRPTPPGARRGAARRAGPARPPARRPGGRSAA